MNTNETKSNKHTGLFITIFILVAIAVAFLVFHADAKTYQKNTSSEVVEEAITDESTTLEILPEVPAEPVFAVTHIAPPDVVKGVYMSSWVAATPSLRNKIIAMIDRTEINAVVVDIKDSTGKISFTVADPEISKYGSSENRIKNIQEFIDELHKKNIYVIGRISVFQDPYLAVEYPHLAVKKKSDGGVWKDRKGLSFLDPNNKEVWDYTVALAKESYAVGFDEINFDYIRFPSDGDISDINYGLGEGATRAGSIEKFFAYLRAELVNDEIHIPMSADLFGMVTTVSDDLGIGQVLEKALPYFDYIAPMVYPSHYPKNWNGYADPASRPYDVIYAAMATGITKAESAGYDRAVFRPWIQDFNLGATYTPEMVKDQIRALQELGIHSWLVWDPANTYTESAFAVQDSVVE
jgi:hypothetical protein